MIAQDFKAPESVSRLQQRALIAGIIGVVICIIGYVKSPETLMRSYLMAFMMIVGLSLGSLGLLMLQHLTSGYWHRNPPPARSGNPSASIGLYPVRAVVLRLPLPLWSVAQRTAAWA